MPERRNFSVRVSVIFVAESGASSSRRPTGPANTAPIPAPTHPRPRPHPNPLLHTRPPPAPHQTKFSIVKRWTAACGIWRVPGDSAPVASFNNVMDDTPDENPACCAHPSFQKPSEIFPARATNSRLQQSFVWGGCPGCAGEMGSHDPTWGRTGVVGG